MAITFRACIQCDYEGCKTAIEKDVGGDPYRFREAMLQAGWRIVREMERRDGQCCEEFMLCREHGGRLGRSGQGSA